MMDKVESAASQAEPVYFAIGPKLSRTIWIGPFKATSPVGPILPSRAFAGHGRAPQDFLRWLD